MSKKNEKKPRSPRKALEIKDAKALKIKALSEQVYELTQDETLDEKSLTGITKAKDLLHAAAERIQRTINKVNKPTVLDRLLKKHTVEELKALLAAKEAE